MRSFASAGCAAVAFGSFMFHPVLAAAVLPLLAAGAEPAAAAFERVTDPRPLCCSNGIALEGDRLFVNQAALDALRVVNVDTGEVETLADEDDADTEELVTPDDLWIDPVTDEVYATEILANTVRRIAPDGTRTRIPAGFDGTAHPNAITGLRRNGEPLRLFISMVQFEPDAETGIWEIDPRGVLPPRLVYGAAGGQVIFGHGMRAPNAMEFGPGGEELFVPETYGGKVWAIDVDAHTARLVYEGRDEAANGITVRFAADGSLLYAEQDSGRLLRLDPAGPADQIPEVVATLDPGIDGIAEHADGRIFLSNFRFGGIAVVEPDGSTDQLFPRSLNLPNGVAPVPGTSSVAVGDLGALAVVDRSSANALSRPKQFIRDDFDIAIGVGATSSCDVYATGFFRATIQYVDVCNPEDPHVEVLPRRSFVAPWDVAVSGNTLWVSDVAGTVSRVTVDGESPASLVPLPTVFANPTGVAIDGDDLYVSESAADQIRIVDALSGALLGVIRDLDEPEGVAVEPDGSVLVVEAGRGKLTRVRPNGSRETLLEDLATDIRGVSVVPVLNYFADVALTEEGEILVTTPGDGVLRVGTAP